VRPHAQYILRSLKQYYEIIAISTLPEAITEKIVSCLEGKEDFFFHYAIDKTFTARLISNDGKRKRLRR
jgi:TFIIF-interacting CTD phosphatase-like protein